jgi:hypothetical protein
MKINGERQFKPNPEMADKNSTLDDPIESNLFCLSTGMFLI